MDTFGKRFKDLRLEKRMNQEELISDFNKKYNYTFTKSAVSQYENDKRIPEINALTDFADYFEVSLDYLIGRSDIKTVLKNKEDGHSNNLSLNKKDMRDILNVLDQTKNMLSNADGLMFDGEPACPEAIESILTAMEMGMAHAKMKNKEKYTPKKYLKDKE
ncbi:helix-turn-helix domain-containing protein [Oceanirhabdus seepicola]|uniref:helix-turn-helix domain-containing protein n=1 Tax=Oceanirhabdus seepicola TaxID=2828781 RepID=UPI002032C606|nr:helix-turn-helix transcriptional regulator [Oceanirhabdus seepicola]